MSFAAVAAAGVSVIGGVVGNSIANKQRNKARDIRNTAVDPGIQRNYALERSGNILLDNYSNYNLPGFSRYRQDLFANQASALAQAERAATSSEDILDAAVRSQLATDQALGSIYTAEAQGKENALMSYLQNLNMQGQDAIRVNNMELDRFDRTLAEAAALEGASMANKNTAFQDVLLGVSPLIQNFTPRFTTNQTTGTLERMPSIFESYFKKNRTNNIAAPRSQTFLNASLNNGLIA